MICMVRILKRWQFWKSQIEFFYSAKSCLVHPGQENRLQMQLLMSTHKVNAFVTAVFGSPRKVSKIFPNKGDTIAICHILMHHAHPEFHFW